MSTFDSSYTQFKLENGALTRTLASRFFRYSYIRRIIKSTDDVLDVGCGTDSPVFKFLTQSRGPSFNTYTGVDLNKVRTTENARATVISNFNFVRQWQVLKKYSPFTCVICTEVLEHMSKTDAVVALKAIKALSSKDATVVLSTPNFSGHKQDIHVHEFTSDEFQSTLHDLGFLVERRFGSIAGVRVVSKGVGLEPDLAEAVRTVHGALQEFYDTEVLASIFAPLFPDESKGCIYKCKLKKGLS